ncbi:hypothetical protein V6D24_33630 [Streptomyces sp. NRRL S-448]
MLTAAVTTDDLVDGLGLGADGYLPKPFDFPALVARIGALARRAHPAVPPVVPPGRSRGGHGAAQSQPGSPATGSRAGGVRRSGAAADLQGPGRLGAGAARTGLGRGADPFTNAVKITISRLRSKVGDPPVIETAAKRGYRI